MKKYGAEALEKIRKERRAYHKQYIQNNRDLHNMRQREWQSKHREEQQDRMNRYHLTKEGRATNLFTSYRQADRRNGFDVDEANLTRDDIIRICFSENSKCVYCGETDWRKLGLDRISKYRPHELGNVLCSCPACNMKRNRKVVGDFIEWLGITVEEWMSKNNATYAEPFILKYPDTF